MASAGRRCWEGDNLAGGAAAGIGSAPVLTHHEQRRIDTPAERARKRAPVEVDRREHLATFADPHTVLVADIGIPDSASHIETDPIRMLPHGRGPDPAPGEGPPSAMSYAVNCSA